jgi:hypothetical protein
VHLPPFLRLWVCIFIYWVVLARLTIAIETFKGK